MRRWLLLSLLLSSLVQADKIPSPKEFLGHDVCEDYYLANYQELTAYWNELDKRSDRLSVESIGKTEDGRDQLMCVITDPGNRRNLQSYRKASERLARAKDFKNDDDARNFARKQKAIIWIDGGLHASEVLVAQQLIEMAYRLTTAQDAETKRILMDCVILLAHANPDGHDWVADHYMRRSDPKTRSAAGLPFLYQKYCGHDNNRDFYANNMAETRNINRILYSTWYPQIVYNHHQSAPAGTIMFVPPFRNPFNYHMDPMTAIATDLVGTHMHQRMIAEGKAGTAMRGSTLYSTWWNGGLRTTTYFHNMIGILTETWGSPNPGLLPFVQRFQIPSTDVPFPVEAGKMWHLRDSLEYEISANYAILDYASRYRERLLFDFYRAGRNSIERGSKDTWSRYPSRLTAGGAESLKKAENRDARMYVIPSNQPDFPTACKFVEKLMQCGIEVERIVDSGTSVSGVESGEFRVVTSASSGTGVPPVRTTSVPGLESGRQDRDDPATHDRDGHATWPVGSFVIRCDQAFRPHILDMFEPQDHPNDFQYPGGPPIPPYDNAGYTLAYQMGVRFYRVLENVLVLTERVIEVPRIAKFGAQETPTRIIFPSGELSAFAAVNVALKQGLHVTDARAFDPTIRGAKGWLNVFGESSALKKYVDNLKGGSVGALFEYCGTESPEAKLESERYFALISARDKAQPWPNPIGEQSPEVALMKKPRVALWDRYGGSMESGWTRYVLEQFAFDFDVVFPPDLDMGDLNSKYDCIILPNLAVPGPGGRVVGTGPGGETGEDDPEPSLFPRETVGDGSLAGVRVGPWLPSQWISGLDSPSPLEREQGSPVSETLSLPKGEGRGWLVPRGEGWLPTSFASFEQGVIASHPSSPSPFSPGRREGEAGAAFQGGGGAQPQSLAQDPTIPYFYRRRIGTIGEKTIKELRKFVENGGHLLCIGSSSINIARQLKLPVESALVDDKGVALPNTKFYIPGSVLKMKLNPGPLTRGMEDYVDAMFDESPAFRIAPPPTPLPATQGIRGEGEPLVVSFFDTDRPLRSGWAWGQETLKGTASVVDVPLGKGRVVLYGPEILFRAQSHGTFKLLFNAIFRSANGNR